MASPEQKLIKQKCSNSACHNVSTVYKEHRSQNQWDNTVRAMEMKMVQRGVALTAEERQTIINYLSANYGL
jgi:hypothetical protein